MCSKRAITQWLKINFVLLMCLLAFYFYYFRPINVFRNSYHSTKTELEEDKNILIWTPLSLEKSNPKGFGRKPFAKCIYKNCFITNNRSFLMSVAEFDAVIFHFSYKRSFDDLPTIRNPHQRYIFANGEPPIYRCPDLKKLSSFFNWTMSYRFDSDIVRRHGYITKKNTDYQIPKPDFIKTRTRLVAWFVSHCQTQSRRENLAESLNKYIAVDKYGNCGVLKCSRRPPTYKLSSDECYDMIGIQYNFYLSFENSYCKDYSTEKLYQILKRNIIPIVYGAGDYKKMAPPHSVINVEDFQTIKDLADYLHWLIKNPNEYLKYFEWKKYYYIDTTNHQFICQLCKKLHTSQTSKVYPNLDAWWWGPNKNICKKF